MEIKKLLLAATVGAGTTVFLTDEQAHARAHLLADGKEKQLGKGKAARKSFVAKSLLHFKAGEKLAIAGDLDRHLEIAFGIKPDEGISAAEANGGVSDELKGLEAKIEAAKNELGELTDQVAQATGELETAKAALAETNAELAGANKAIEEVKADLATPEEELEAKTSDSGDDQDSSDEDQAS